MARTSEQIEAIITELKSNRDARDAHLESAAEALDGVNDNQAKKLRGFKHTIQKAKDLSLCIRCELRKEEDGRVRFMICEQFDFADREERASGTTYSIPGIRTRLLDESFTVTGATTVENL